MAVFRFKLFSPAISAGLIFIPLGACTPEISEEPVVFSGDPFPAAAADAVYGRRISDSPEGELGLVLAARLAPEAGVVVLDGVPPHVKVFDKSGRLKAAFAKQGKGPGEAARPTAIAVQDSVAALFDQELRRVSLYTIEGEFLYSVGPLPLAVLAATSTCGGDWILYGPRVEPDGLASWVHRLRLRGPESFQLTSVFRDTVPQRISFGKPYGLVATRSGALLRHDSENGPALIQVKCAPSADALTVVRMEINRQDLGSGDFPFSYGERPSIGLAALEDAVVLAEIGLTESMMYRTRIGLLAPGQKPKTMLMEGEHVLSDSRPGTGVLFYSSDPMPTLRLIREDTLLDRFKQ